MEKFPPFFFILVFMNIYVSSHKFCGSIKNVNVSFIDGYGNDFHKRFLQEEWNRLRVFVDYTSLDRQLSSNQDQLNSIKKVLDQTINMYQNLIMVKPLNRKIRISSCGDAIISNKITNEGVDADIVIFPIYDSTMSEGVEAFASSCVQELNTGKPVAGVIGFTQNFKFDKSNWLEYNTYLAFHEMTHIFVFNDILFEYFRDSSGNKIALDKIIGSSVVNGLSRRKIITPKVIEAAKKHYNCDSIDGVELENQGGSGTSGSHWEARIMLTDYMIGQSYDDVTISEITLALFEDSGWYKVNYYTGGLFRFGKNQGCNFLTSKCVSDEKSNFREFCESLASPQCTNTRSAKGYCLIANYVEKLDPQYIYFNRNDVGGFPLADYCPVPLAGSTKSAYLPLSCTFGLINNYPPQLEEKVSNSSACFISSLVNEKYKESMSNFVGKNKAICYQYSCDINNKNVIVNIGNTKAICPTNGGTSNIKGYSGILYCPDYNSICTNTKDCYSMVDCALKKVTPYETTNKYAYTVNYTRPTGPSVLISNLQGYTSGISSGGGPGAGANLPITYINAKMLGLEFSVVLLSIFLIIM
jgi:leishmanolysin